MKKGKLLGKGMTAEIYEWGDNEVLKLYLNGRKEELISYEAMIGQKIHVAGVPSPAVRDIVEINGRKGLVFERVHGKTLFNALLTESLNSYNLILQMARFHYQIHQYSIDGIPSQKKRFEYKINRSSGILGDKMKKILEYIDRLPEGNSLCHGDFYSNNVMLSNNELIAIDWNSAYKGDPLGDVCRTCLIFNSPGFPLVLPPVISDMVATLSIYPKWLAYRIYLNEYMKIAKVKFEDIDAWMLPVAAARLKDRIHGEEKWLMKIINKRLEQMEA